MKLSKTRAGTPYRFLLISGFAVALAGGCADAARLTAVELPPEQANSKMLHGDEAMASAHYRALRAASRGDSSLFNHLRWLENLRAPVGPRLSTAPTGTEAPRFLDGTATRATISPYDAGILVTTRFKFAYHVRIDGNWSLSGQSGSGARSGPYTFSGGAPLNWNTGEHFSAEEIDVNVYKSCGLIITAGTTHTISRTEYIPGYGDHRWSPASASMGTSDRGSQRACCPSAREANYDPYEDSDSCGDDGNGSGDAGSGITYSPGDYTGGETVDWATGTGNGGNSLCGSDAKVEYICIDYFDEGSGQWVAWGCGYATSC